MSRLEYLYLAGKTLLTDRKLIRGNNIAPPDGSRDVIYGIEELATLEGPLLDKIFTIYASGVDEHVDRIFDARQLLAMIKFNDFYKPNAVIKRNNSMGERTFCCVEANNKLATLTALCEAIDGTTIYPHAYKNELNCYRDDLRGRGVSPNILEQTSDKELLVYSIANEAQFIFAVDHPFWERNGRTSEEVLQLVCAEKGVQRRVFWDDISQRYNPVTQSRMGVINGCALGLLPHIAQQMGMQDSENIADMQSLYRTWFSEKGQLDEYEFKKFLLEKTPLKYKQSRAIFPDQELMAAYFDGLQTIVDKRLAMIHEDRLPQLMQDEINQQLVAHFLTFSNSVNIYSPELLLAAPTYISD